MPALDDIVTANHAYAGDFPYASASGRPVKKLAVLTCMDARIDPARALGLEPGDAHVIRNAGGLATDDAIRSLVISQHFLGTEEIAVIHHSSCGMLGLDDAAASAQIESSTGTAPPFALGGFEDLEGDVAASVAVITSSPLLRSRVVRGFVYEVETGRLREVTA